MESECEQGPTSPHPKPADWDSVTEFHNRLVWCRMSDNTKRDFSAKTLRVLAEARSSSGRPHPRIMNFTDGQRTRYGPWSLDGTHRSNSSTHLIAAISPGDEPLQVINACRAERLVSSLVSQNS